MEIEIPADARTVTLKIAKSSEITLRGLLPQIAAGVELVIINTVDHVTNGRRSVGDDLYKVKAPSGAQLLEKLERSYVVEGEYLLDLPPEVKLSTSGDPCIQVRVKPAAADEVK